MTFKHRIILILLLFITILPAVAPAAAAPAAQTSGDWAIPNGHFFTQTAGGQGGFSVVDDSQARFWSEFKRLGGLQNVGYPISQRFTYDGFVVQAFQKLVLQWRPEVSQAWPMNVFDELSKKGFDDTLFAVRQTPYPLTNFDTPGASWDQVVAKRWALLDANPAIKQRYFSVGDPLNVFGLPTSRVEDMGNHYAVRTQRAVFQQWKENVPWAAKGQVTIANGGDIGKELAWLSGPYLQPQPAPGAPAPTPLPATPTPVPPAGDAWSTDAVAASANSQRIYALQTNRETLRSRLMLSDNGGNNWSPFTGGLPSDSCPTATTVEVAMDTLYVSTCGDAFYRWTGSSWAKQSNQSVDDVAAAPNKSELLWACPYGSGTPIRSADAGKSWLAAATTPAAATMCGEDDIAVDGTNPDRAYALLVGRGSASATLSRAMAAGQWEPIAAPVVLHQASLATDVATGALYLMSSDTAELWRSTNPLETDPSQVRWEKVYDFDDQYAYTLHDVEGQTIFVTQETTPLPGNTQLLRSSDGGKNWQVLAVR